MTPAQEVWQGISVAKMTAHASPDAFVVAQDGWRRPIVEALRAVILAAAPFEEGIKWGNLVFMSGGFCALIHVEPHRVMLGFLPGKRLVEMEPRIKLSGKYELGNRTFVEGDIVDPAHVTALAARAAALNAEPGDPQAEARRQLQRCGPTEPSKNSAVLQPHFLGMTAPCAHLAATPHRFSKRLRWSGKIYATQSPSSPSAA